MLFMALLLLLGTKAGSRSINLELETSVLRIFCVSLWFIVLKIKSLHAEAFVPESFCTFKNIQDKGFFFL